MQETAGKLRLCALLQFLVAAGRFLVCLSGSIQREKGFPNKFERGVHPGEDNYHEKEYHPQPDRCRHAQRGRLYPDVHRVPAADAHPVLCQDGLLRPARPAGCLCTGPGVRRGHQLYEEPAAHHHQGHLHRLRGRAVQLYAGRGVLRCGGLCLQAPQEPQDRHSGCHCRCSRHGRVQRALQLLYHLPGLCTVLPHAAGSHSGDVSGHSALCRQPDQVPCDL